MIKSASARINLTALQHNFTVVRQQTAGSKVLAVIKANAYGHGMVPVAKALTDADALGVARTEEAVLLRESGIEKRLLLLEGVTERAEFEPVLQHHLDVVVHCDDQLQMLDTARLGDSVRIWLKIDTGMNRLGIAPEFVSAVLDRLASNKRVLQPVILMTHLADSGSRDATMTNDQIAVFRACTADHDGPRSIANSGGIFGWPDAASDWARPGIALFGASPFNGGRGSELGLRPVMTLTTRLIAVKIIPAGGGVGYGGTWVADKPTRIGIAAIGYGDGYIRTLTTGTPVLVNGTRARIVGRNSMDMVCVDLSDVVDASIGDPIVLWGEGLPVDEVAEHADTIPHELLCAVASRVEREYVSDN